MEGIQGLIDKIKKDASHSGDEISNLQKQIQALVGVRKATKKEWEENDTELESEINKILDSISLVLNRKLTAEDVIRYLNV